MSDTAHTIPPVDSLDACVGGIMFADVVGFTRLDGDEQVLRFFHEFHGVVAACVNAGECAPLVRNTWGDGLYFVFDDLRAAGLCALGLCDVIASIDWQSRGLPHDLEIRIALHSGPLYRILDAVTGMVTWSGRQVARAARLEPVTPAGTVYASREFAAVAAGQGIQEFCCEPVGLVRVAKDDGLFPIYVVRWSPA